MKKRLLKRMIMGKDDYGKKIRKVRFWQVKGKRVQHVCGQEVRLCSRKRKKSGLKRKSAVA